MSEIADVLNGVTPGRRGPGPIGKFILILCWLAVCGLSIYGSVPSLLLATGQVGTPGTLTVTSCVTLGQGRYDCDGTFVPASGGPPVAVDASPDSEAGEVTPAQLTPEGDRAVPSGTKGVLAALSLAGVGIGGLGYLPYVLVYWARLPGRRVAAVAGAVISVAGLLLAIAGVTASVL
ncbi:hypothetical protein GT755_02810 [Herbidospora sp. NEAU-GS84]|uniref:Uncharacterized protein n=1 Tax=Herbidospora solisilvae TaxID=2696284 RepID=A0A7C9N582_9ACTN|nr:hypothetical protein [Herbidospora solisilvae]NAS20613.1 hypothetical protein [Herbidospora solisilvae]